MKMSGLTCLSRRLWNSAMALARSLASAACLNACWNCCTLPRRGAVPDELLLRAPRVELDELVLFFDVDVDDAAASLRAPLPLIGSMSRWVLCEIDDLLDGDDDALVELEA